jgi:hypothetical protein
VPSSTTRIIKNTRISDSQLASILVRLMQVVNDMGIVNDSLREWSTTTDRRRMGRKGGARAFFARVQMAYVYEALLIIQELKKDADLTAEVEKCEKKTSDSFATVCAFLETPDYKRLLRIRNNVGFHYDAKLAERSVRQIAEKLPEDTSSMTLGQDPLDWYFQLGDKVTERIVVRHIFEVPEGADIAKESDEIGGRIFDMAQALADFAGYFIWEHTKL